MTKDSGSDRSTDDGARTDTVDTETRKMLDLLEREPFLDLAMTPAQMRRAFDSFYAKVGYPALPVASVEAKEISGKAGPIAIRIYHPVEQQEAALPVLVFFHGGGMMMGSLEAYDGLCRRLANRSGCIIVSSAYRLAPENKFPAAVDDALAAYSWARGHAASFGGDPEKVAIGGESGGGNLAAVVTQILRDEGDFSVPFQLLINPAVGTRGGSTSMEKYGRGFFFEPEALEWFYGQYLADMADLDNPRASPILATSFANLPPAFIVIAGHDILRDDIELYAQLLREAGVPVETSTYETTIHGFTVMAGMIEAGARAIDECGQKLRQALLAAPYQ